MSEQLLAEQKATIRAAAHAARNAQTDTDSVSAQITDRVMEMAQYHYLRECELDAALAQSRADVAAGRFVMESAQQHM